MCLFEYHHIPLVIHKWDKMFHVKHIFLIGFVKSLVKLSRTYPQRHGAVDNGTLIC